MKLFSDKIILPNKRNVLKVHLYTRFLEYNLQPSENDLDILVELYCFGGYQGKDMQEKFITLCLEKKYMKSKQSVRNTLSRYTNLGVLDKPRNLMLSLNERYIPKVECDKLFLQHIVSHAE